MTKLDSQKSNSGVIYKFQSGLCNESYYGEYIRHLNVRIGEDTGLSPLTKSQVKPKNSSIANHVLFCSHSASYDKLLQLNKSLLIMRDKPSLNSNITLASLYLFDKP